MSFEALIHLANWYRAEHVKGKGERLLEAIRETFWQLFPGGEANLLQDSRTLKTKKQLEGNAGWDTCRMLQMETKLPKP